MNKFTKLSIACKGLAVAAFLIAGGGLLTMYSLNLTEGICVPQPIVFAMLMVPVLGVFALASDALAQKYPT